MSVNVNIRTKKANLDFAKLQNDLATTHPNLATTTYEDGCEFFLDTISTREVSVANDENGYEVRITTLACREDYELFVETIRLVEQSTGGKVYYEDDDDELIKDVDAYFSEDWINSNLESDARVLTVLARDEHEIELYGPVCPFCVGSNLMQDLGITTETDWKEKSQKLIERFRYSQYARPKDARRTTTSMTIRSADADPNDEKAEKRLTVYQFNKYDMISYADYIALKARSYDSPLLLSYKDFMKIVPKQWERFDNFQYFTTPLTRKQFIELWEKAVPYALGKAPEVSINTKHDTDESDFIKAMMYADATFLKENTKKDELPPCMMHRDCPSGYYMPHIFHVIAKCEEIVFGQDSYAKEYMPVIHQMRTRANQVIEFWEQEIGLPHLDKIPYDQFSEYFLEFDKTNSLEDMTDYSKEEFEEGGNESQDIDLYYYAMVLNFNKVQKLLQSGANPDVEMIPADNEDVVICTIQDIFNKYYAAFQDIYARCRWYLESGEMVVDNNDLSNYLTCAAFSQMFKLISEERKKYLDTQA